MAILSVGLAARFTNLIGLSKAGLAAEMTAGILASSDAAIAQAGKTFVRAGIRSGIEGFLSGAVGELVLTTADEKTWKQSIWGVITTYGAAILKGGGIGAVTGVITGGTLEALGTYVGVKRIQGLVQQLEHAGINQQRLSTMKLGAVQALGKADAALATGKIEEAEAAFKLLQGELSPEELNNTWKTLCKQHLGAEPKLLLKALVGNDALLADFQKLVKDEALLLKLLSDPKVADAPQLATLLRNPKIVDASQLATLLHNPKIANAATLEKLLSNAKLADITELERCLKLTDSVSQLEGFLTQVDNVTDLERLINLAGLGNPPVADPLRLERTLKQMGSGQHTTVDIENALNAQKQIDSKILAGEPKALPTPGLPPAGTAREIRGGHSPQIIIDPDYRILSQTANSDGTIEAKFQKLLYAGPPPVYSKTKTSTLAPQSWSDNSIFQAGDAISGTPPVQTAADGRTLHLGKANGIDWAVIKDSSGAITSSFPTGGKAVPF